MKIFLISLFFVFNTVAAQKVKIAPSDTKEMTEMLSMFEGEFDNFQQYYYAKDNKIPNPHEHIHSIFKKMDLPQIGKDVFYVMQYMDGDTSKIYRQRLYIFTFDKIEKATRLDIFSFKIDSIYYQSHLKPQQLTNIKPEDLKSTEGCYVFWKKINNEFIGYMPKDLCTFISKRSGKKIYATDSLKLNNSEIWIRDEAFDSIGNRIYGREDKIHHKLKRCTNYKGWILLQKAGFENEYINFSNQIWHDQGKRIRLKTEDGKETKYEVELATVIYGKNLELLKLAIYEVGNTKAVAYTWASPGSKNIGINLRWIQCGLTKM